MQLLSLAAQGLLRNPRRTVLTTLAVAVGLGMMVLMISMQAGTYAAMIESAVAATSGHVVVQEAAYVSDPRTERLVKGSDALAATLRQALPDAVVAQRLSVDGLLMSPDGSAPCVALGLEPEPELEVSPLADRLVEGEWLSADAPDGIVLGYDLARSLAVGLGDKVVFQAQYGDEPVSLPLRVRGITRSGAADLDGVVSAMDLSAARGLLQKTDVANQITVHLDDAAYTDDAFAAAAAALPPLPDGVELMTWEDAQPGLLELIDMDRAGGGVMMVFMAIIVAMGVLNTVLMSVMERTREFGVLMALGVRPRYVLGLILTEGLLLGLLSAALGLALGLALSWPLVVYGLDITAYAGEAMSMEAVVMDSKMYGRFDLDRTAMYASLAVMLTVLAAVWPAWTATRLKPVEAMRHA